jgi:hypothetical protein
MFNPIPWDDPSAVNRPALPEEAVQSVISGTRETAGYISNSIVHKINDQTGKVIVAMDGNAGARFEQVVNLVCQDLIQESITVSAVPFSSYFIPGMQLDTELREYLEGVWGGHCMKKIRGLPDHIRNCAWVFDLIPLEVSIVVEAGKHLLEFPFFLPLFRRRGPPLWARRV